MGLVNFVISTVGKCLDAVCLLLDVNFLIVHTIIRSLLAVVNFINSLPTLFVNSLVALCNFTLFCLVSMAEGMSDLAQGTVATLGSLVLALDGLLESLKMVGYLSMHVLLRGKEHLCRCLLSLQEACSIALSLLVYFTNTLVNFALIAALHLYSAVVSVWQTVSSPLQTVLELTLTSFTCLYSILVGTSAILWSPCKLVIDFLVSLIHMFISIFILNFYGLLLTVTIALTTTAYLNPALSRQVVTRVVDYIYSNPSVQGFHWALHCLALIWQNILQVLRRAAQHLNRIFHHLIQLESQIWQELSRHSSQLGLVLRTQLPRVRGDGDPGEERRDPPDGSAGDGAHRDPQDLALPSSSQDRPLKKQPPAGKQGQSQAENLLTLLNEQEDRKKCVICQDCPKTVVLLPCRHLCLCTDCTNILLRQPLYQQNCPLCRHMILNTMEVYL